MLCDAGQILFLSDYDLAAGWNYKGQIKLRSRAYGGAVAPVNKRVRIVRIALDGVALKQWRSISEA